jgi:DNA (cytosine-5)-methyltransferase 1
MVEFHNSTFLLTSEILQNLETDEIKLRGSLLKKSSMLNRLLPEPLNELCFIYEILLDDPRPISEQRKIEIGLQGIKEIRSLLAVIAEFTCFACNSA